MRRLFYLLQTLPFTKWFHFKRLPESRWEQDMMSLIKQKQKGDRVNDTLFKVEKDPSFTFVRKRGSVL